MAIRIRILGMAAVVVVFVACAQSVPSPTISSDEALQEQHTPAMRGVCWVGNDSIDASCLDSVIHCGVNYLSITPFAYQDRHDQPALKSYLWDDHPWSESNKGILHTNALAKARGMKVMLKPHIWMHAGTDVWRQDIAMETEADWQRWFANYGAYILHYARVAEEGGIASLCIGTELHQTVLQRPDDWRALIAKIREVYGGELTYAANFYHEFQDITFWDALDYIGIQAYFPLSESEVPTVDELNKGWEPHIAAIAKVSEAFDKPVVFTEVGYRSQRGAAARPWEWPDGSKATFADTSGVTQARCYEAMFQSLEQQPWMEGVFIWKWFPRHYAMPAEYEAKRLERVRKWQSTTPRIDFTPQGKAAEEVLRHWFHAWSARE